MGGAPMPLPNKEGFPVVLAKEHPLRLKDTDFFSYKALVMLYLPALVEQILISVLGIADTLMASYLSDEATAGISYVITVSNWANAFFSSMAAGGSVLTSQYIGRMRRAHASAAVRMSLIANGLIAAVFCGILMIDCGGALQLLLGDIDAVTLGYAETYFIYIIPTYFLHALNYVSTATMRAEGNTRVPMILSVSNLSLSLVLKLVFSYGFDMGVAGFSLAALIAAAVTTCISLLLLERGKGALKVFSHLHGARFFNFPMAIHSIAVGLPVAIDNSLYQLGIIILARLLVTYGVVHGAANGIATQLQPIQYMVGNCWGLVGIVAVSRAVGAGDIPQARRYFRVITALGYAVILVCNIFCILFSEQIVLIFGGSAETHRIAAQMLRVYSYFAIPFYIISFVMPQMLRGAGDTKFTMWISIAAMFVVRIGLGYVFGTICGLGAVGLYIAMGCNWIARGACFTLRYRSGKWETKKVI